MLIKDINTVVGVIKGRCNIMVARLTSDDYMNTSGYKFSELFDIDEIQKLQDLFSATTGVASIITEPDGTPITKPSGFCCLCNEVIRGTKLGLKNCQISDSIIGSPQKDGPKIQRCLSGGLMDGGASIIIDGNHIASWLIGQVYDEDYKNEDLLQYADVIGVNRDIYLNELSKVKHMSSQQFENVCNLLYMNAQLLARYSVKNVSLTDEINKKLVNEVEMKNINVELESMVVDRTSQLEKINYELEEANATLEEEIYERKNAEEKIKKLNEDLELKVVERTKQIEEVNKVLDTSRRRMNERLQKYQVLVERANDAMLFLDKEGKIFEVNDAAIRIYGYTHEEFCVMSIYDLRHIEKPSGIIKQMKIADEKGIIFEAIHYLKDGSHINVEVSSQGTFLGNQRVLISIIRDITERKKAEEEITYLSYHDQLTGLYNRRFYEEELKRLDIDKNYPITLVMADVNGLKLTNDAFGHKAGDMLLEKIAHILKRECGPNEIVARIGGDEFVLLLTRTNTKDTEEILRRINTAISKEKTEKVMISVSIGYAVKYDVSEDIDEVFRRAEDYMYRNKLSERSSIRSKTIDLIMKSLYEKNNREMLHSKRVSKLCEIIAKRMDFEKDDIIQIRLTGLMHDIGKIAINDNILNKVEKLDNDEWDEIKRHSEIGYRILSSVNEFWQIASYVLEHHERWDGKGYPKNLKGKEISIEARIIAVADSYDAMTSDRAYRKALSEEEAIKELRKYSGTQFDPDVVKVFVEYIK